MEDCPLPPPLLHSLSHRDHWFIVSISPFHASHNRGLSLVSWVLSVLISLSICLWTRALSEYSIWWTWMILDPANPDKVKERSPWGLEQNDYKQPIYLQFSFPCPLMKKVLFWRPSQRTSWSDHIACWRHEARPKARSGSVCELQMFGVFIIHTLEWIRKGLLV